MASGLLDLEPTIRQMLKTGIMSEAQVLCGEEELDRHLSQVCYSHVPATARGSLLVIRAEELQEKNLLALSHMEGIVVLRSDVTDAKSADSAPARTTSPKSKEYFLEKLLEICHRQSTPVLSLSVFGDTAELVESIRLQFIRELKRCSARVHAYLTRSVLERGIADLVAELAAVLERPVCVETASFDILAAEGMSSLPVNQRREFTEDVADKLNRELRVLGDQAFFTVPFEPFRIGRRLVMPIILEGMVVGYLSVMLKSGEESESLSEYLLCAASACLIEFRNKIKEISLVDITKNSMLKDLLSGRSLSSSDQERLEQYFGFDIFEEFVACAVKILPADLAREPKAEERRLANVEMEGAQVFILPCDTKKGETWQTEAQKLVEIIKGSGTGLVVQLGAGRPVKTILELPECYREARQALVTGSISSGGQEFILGFGDLGVKRILYLVIDHPEVERFYQEHLAPLEAYDKEWEAELVPTLKVYIEQGANLNSAAKELFVHRHTMRYRLEQIAELLNVDIDSTEVLLNLQIAFLIRSMKGKEHN